MRQRLAPILPAVAFALALSRLAAPAPAQAPTPPATVDSIELVCLEHLDIGFTDSPQEVARLEKEHLDHAIALCEERPDFRWTIESLWQLQRWRERTDDPAQVARLRRLIDEKRIEVTGGLANFHTGTMDAWALLRAFEGGEARERECGIGPIAIDTAVQDDVPGFAWFLPTALARGGVRYFMAGANTAFGGGTTLAPAKSPFWWEARDGSRVLTWVAPGSYGEAERFGLSIWSRDDEAETKIPEQLAALAKLGYPHRRYVVMATTGDNLDPAAARSIIRKVDAWNAKHALPKVSFTTAGAALARFLADARAASGREDGGLAVARGDWSGHWEPVKANAPLATALWREAQALLPGAEALSLRAAVELGLPYPRHDLEEAARKILLYAEHSQSGTVGWPKLTTKEQVDAANLFTWELAWSAHDAVTTAIDRATRAYAEKLAADGDTIVVANPTPLLRAETVAIVEPDRSRCEGRHLVDARGEPAPLLRRVGGCDVPVMGVQPFAFAKLRVVADRDGQDFATLFERGRTLVASHESTPPVFRWTPDRGPEDRAISSIAPWFESADRAPLRRLSLRLPFPADGELEPPASLRWSAPPFREDVMARRLDWTATIDVSSAALAGDGRDPATLPDPLRVMVPLDASAPPGAAPASPSVRWTTAAGVIGDDDFLPGARAIACCTSGAIRLSWPANSASSESPATSAAATVRTFDVLLREPFTFQRGAPGWIGPPRDAPGSPIWIHLLDRPFHGETKDQGRVLFERVEPAPDDRRTFHLALRAGTRSSYAAPDTELVRQALAMRAPLRAMRVAPWFPSAASDVGTGPLVEVDDRVADGLSNREHTLVLSCRPRMKPGSATIDEVLVEIQEIEGVASARPVRVHLHLPGFAPHQDVALPAFGVATLHFPRL